MIDDQINHNIDENTLVAECIKNIAAHYKHPAFFPEKLSSLPQELREPIKAIIKDANSKCERIDPTDSKQKNTQMNEDEVCYKLIPGL